MDTVQNLCQPQSKCDYYSTNELSLGKRALRLTLKIDEFDFKLLLLCSDFTAGV